MMMMMVNIPLIRPYVFFPGGDDGICGGALRFQ